MTTITRRNPITNVTAPDGQSKQFRGELCEQAHKGYLSIKSSILLMRPDPEYEANQKVAGARARIKILEDGELATPLEHAEAVGYLLAFYVPTAAALFEAFAGLEKLEVDMYAGKLERGVADAKNTKGN